MPIAETYGLALRTLFHMVAIWWPYLQYLIPLGIIFIAWRLRKQWMN